MSEGHYAIAVGQFAVGAGFEQQTHNLLVVRAAVTEDHGFHESGPAEIVDVVERRAGSDEAANDFGVA